MFGATCDLVGVAYREYATTFRVYRRDAAEALAQHVGVKR
jgi:hypothetical protein